MKKILLLTLGLVALIPCLTAKDAAKPAATTTTTANTKTAAKAKTSALPTAGERFASMAKAEEPSFRRHVVPLMSRAGCSGRECHGSFQGRGGFQLSLFGYDFEKDHEAITKGKGGEDEVRVNADAPAKSLILTKPTMQVSHKGKERIKKDSWEYNLVLKWLQAGAKSDVKETGDFDRLEIFPKEIVFKKAGDYVQLRVLAHWKDGTIEDITQLTRFRSNDDSVSAVSDTGLVTAKEGGDTHIVAFYDNGVLPIPTILPVSDKNGAKYPRVATRTKVDALVVAKLSKLGIVPSEVCTDAEFLRRASLDIAGTLPTPDEVTKFIADKSPTKRAAKVDALLNTKAYAAWWTTKLNDYLGNNPRLLRGGGGNNNYGGTFSRQWYDWMNARVEKNEPFDQMMAGIILATGRTKPEQTYEEFAREMSSYLRAENPASFADRPNMPYFWQRTNIQKPEEKALAFAHSFLGVRIECAQCHKHPFDQWTKTDFVQFQAFFESVSYAGGKGGSGKPNDMNEKVTYASLTKEIKDAVPATDPKGGNNQKGLQDEFDKRVKAGEPAPWQELFIAQNRGGKTPVRSKGSSDFSGRVLTPKILGGGEVLLNEYPDPRGPLMDWLRHKDNPYFARAFVNRVWASYFGRGIVEPADDMNLANPPVNRELMDYLTDGFVTHGFDMKWLHREILNSDTYQRSWKTTPSNKLDEKNFSRMVLRRLPAEVVVDAIAFATAGTEQLAKFTTDIETRAIGPNVDAGGKGGGGGKGASVSTLTMFGKPARETNCDCERSTDPTLLQTLYTRNDPEMLGRLEAAKNGTPAWITELRQQSRSKGGGDKGGGDKGGGDKGGTEKRREQDSTGERAGLERKIESLKAEAQKNPELKPKLEAVLARLAELPKESQPAVKGSPVAPTGALAGERLDQVIAEAFLRTVSRPPTAREVEEAKKDIAAARDPVDGVRDLLWAMLNTREFMINH